MFYEDTEDPDDTAGSQVVGGRSREARQLLGNVRTRVRTLLSAHDADTMIDAVLAVDELVSRRVRHALPLVSVRTTLEPASGILVLELEGGIPESPAECCVECVLGERILDALPVRYREDGRRVRAELPLPRRSRIRATRRVPGGRYGGTQRPARASRHQTLPG